MILVLNWHERCGCLAKKLKTNRQVLASSTDGNWSSFIYYSFQIFLCFLFQCSVLSSRQFAITGSTDKHQCKTDF